MSIYSKERTKITINTILISLAVIVGLWLLLFVTDYILYKNGVPMIFSKMEIKEENGNHVTIETGLGYYSIVEENNTPELYLFGYKIQ